MKYYKVFLIWLTFIIIITSLTGLICGLGMYISHEDGKFCNKVVIMNDGSQIEATKVTTYENGMSYILQCNGEQVDIPTINIKMVKQIKSPN